MFKNKTIGVVIPAYNEEALILRTIRSVPDFVDHIVVIDDASTDRTGQIVHDASENNRRLAVITHKKNGGVGAAITSGYIWCRDNEIDVAVVMAGDSQMDPDDMPALLNPVLEGEVDYTKGNRLLTGEAWRTIPHIRYLGNSMMTLLTKIASGYWHVTDSQCGYTAINSRALKLIDWRKMHRRYGQPNDILVRLNIYSLRVRDIQVKPIYSVGEKSGIKPLRMIPKLSWLLLKIFLYRMVQKYIIRDFHPLIFFYLLGFASFFSGLLLGFFIIFVRLFHGPNSVAMTSALLTTFLLVSGSQSLFFAMWFDMENNRGLR